MQKININLIIYLPIIFFFFPAFSFFIPALNWAYQYYFLILYFCLAILFIIDRQKILQKVFNVYKKTPLKYFVITLIMIAVNSCFLSILGITKITQSCRSIIMQLILFIIPILVYYVYILNTKIQFENFIRIFTLLYYVIILLGFVAYIGELFNITIINSFFDILANARIIKFAGTNYNVQANRYIAYGLPRLDNLYEEPSLYARFLFLFLPFVYSIKNLKMRLTQNNFINKLIKHTIVLFSWISVILTLSPIYLIFCILITVLFYHKKIYILIKRHFFCSCMGLILTFLILKQIDFSDTYVSRIANVLTQIKTFEDFIIVEGSLATRIVNYFNSFIIFLKHPYTGVGIGNLGPQLVTQLPYSPLSLPLSIQSRLHYSLTTGNNMPYDYGFIYGFLAENGIIIASVFTLFNFKLLQYINLILKKESEDSFNFIIANCFKYMLIALFILMFYDLVLITLEMIFLYAVIVSFIYFYKRSHLIGVRHGK